MQVATTAISKLKRRRMGSKSPSDRGIPVPSAFVEPDASVIAAFLPTDDFHCDRRPQVGPNPAGLIDHVAAGCPLSRRRPHGLLHDDANQCSRNHGQDTLGVSVHHQPLPRWNPSSTSGDQLTDREAQSDATAMTVRLNHSTNAIDLPAAPPE
jgi:hypothetical protein